jgi:hypothetical protein
MKLGFKRFDTVLGLATIAVVLAIVPGSLSADPLTYTASGSANTSAGVDFTYDIGDSLGSSNISYAYVASGSDSAFQAFSFEVSLPSLPGGSLLDASLDLSVSNPSGSSSYSQYYGGDGYYYYYNGCIFGCNNWSSPTIYFNEGQYAVIDSVSDGTSTWDGSVSDGTLNLASLGFGDDLLSGGVLTISGYREVYSNPSVANSGFNGYSNVTINYNESGSEYASLNLDADPADPPAGVPEPATISLMIVGLAGLWKQRQRIWS